MPHTNADLMPPPATEGCWYFNEGEAIPLWLQQPTNCVLRAGCDLVVTSRDGYYEIRTRYPVMREGAALILGEATGTGQPHVQGGGRGVMFFCTPTVSDEVYEAVVKGTIPMPTAQKPGQPGWGLAFPLPRH